MKVKRRINLENEKEKEKEKEKEIKKENAKTDYEKYIESQKESIYIDGKKM